MVVWFAHGVGEAYVEPVVARGVLPVAGDEEDLASMLHTLEGVQPVPVARTGFTMTHASPAGKQQPHL